MLTLVSQSLSLNAPLRPTPVQRAVSPQMADISAYGDIWGIEAKEAVFNAWDPEKPRDYDNFNPFERNLDGAMSDMNGCFPGESRGYKPPNRPDASWSIMQEEAKKMEEIKKDPKYSLSGKPGCYSLKWQENLGAPP
mmetsp:Transcript_40642/g.128150  ORF Transcript_40642/g.128150 Transcript_40642/m.128150 type:complete len:137 (+) Transcript_40642:55-465(+)